MATATLHDTLLQDRLRALRRALRGMTAGDAVAIHRARTATRRLRALLPLLAVEPDLARSVRRRLRRAGRRLGLLRDLDTQVLLMDELLLRRRAGSTRLREVRRAARRARKAAHAKVVEKALDRRLEDVIAELRSSQRGSRTVRGGVADVSFRRAAQRWVRERATQLLQRLEEAGTVYDPIRVHEVRIATKKLRYVAELGEAASGRPGADHLASLKQAQDVLGLLHDTQVLMDRVRAVDPPAAQVLEQRCRELHTTFLSERPSLLRVAGDLARPASASTRKRPAVPRRGRGGRARKAD